MDWIQGILVGMIIGLIIGRALLIWDESSKEKVEEMEDHKEFLKTHPLCVRCQAEGKYRRAVMVFDKHKDWEALCQECWDKAEEDYYCGWA